MQRKDDDPLQINDIMSIDIENGKITIKADPELAQDLVYILSSLLDLSHTLRAKIIHTRTQASALDIHDIQKRQNEFRLKSEIFRRFQEHMNNGCNGEAKVSVTEGRRLFKAGSAAKKKAQTDNSHTSPVCDSKLIPSKKKRPV